MPNILTTCSRWSIRQVLFGKLFGLDGMDYDILIEQQQLSVMDELVKRVSVPCGG